MLWSKFASNSLPFGLLPRLVIWVKTLARKQFYTQDPLDCCSGGKICSWEHWVVGNRKLFHDGTAQGLFLDVSLPSLSPGTPTDRSWARKCLVMYCLYVSLSCFTLRNISSTLKCGPVLKSSLLPWIIVQFFIAFVLFGPLSFPAASRDRLSSSPPINIPSRQLSKSSFTLWAGSDLMPSKKTLLFCYGPCYSPLPHPDNLCTIFHHQTFCICLLFYLNDFSP